MRLLLLLLLSLFMFMLALRAGRRASWPAARRGRLTPAAAAVVVVGEVQEVAEVGGERARDGAAPIGTISAYRRRPTETPGER